MSYVRFGEDGSDVYVFAGHGYLECCGCLLFAGSGEPLQFSGPDAVDAMLGHLRMHRLSGHVVPQCAFDRLDDPDARVDVAADLHAAGTPR